MRSILQSDLISFKNLQNAHKMFEAILVTFILDLKIYLIDLEPPRVKFFL